MKNLITLLIILKLSYSTFSQGCITQHYNIAKSSLINVIGIDKYNMKIKGDKILYLEFVCDTLGNVLSVYNYRVFDKNLSKKFRNNKMDICNPETEISNSVYFKMNNYKPKYSLLLKVF